MRRALSLFLWLGLLAAIGLSGPVPLARAELVLKLLVVNPSETDVKDFDIRSPLPPEVKPEHVLDADGLKVDYDSQSGAYLLVGRVTLKPKESVTKKVVLEDVWIVPAERLSSLRRELAEIEDKLRGSAYEDRGRMLSKAIERRLAEVEDAQDQPFTNPMEHITSYREHLKTLDAIESDLVSLRQLMVMAALRPATPASTPAVAGGEAEQPGGREIGGLSILTTWRLIFIILGLLGFISLSFFLMWQRQLKLQLAKQAAEAAERGEGARPADNASVLQLPPTPPKT